MFTGEDKKGEFFSALESTQTDIKFRKFHPQTLVNVYLDLLSGGAINSVKVMLKKIDIFLNVKKWYIIIQRFQL